MESAPPSLALVWSDGDMECRWRAFGSWDNAEALREAFVASGVAPDRLQQEVPAEVIKRLATGEQGFEVVIARGVPPTDGEDGLLDLQVLEDSVLSISEVDVIDVRDRGRPETVDAEQVLGRWHKPTEGVPGATARGVPIPAKPGKPVAVKLGEGIHVDSQGQLRAAHDGFVVLVRGVLSVRKDWRVAGDVDHHTGHVRLDRGDLTVDGTVKPGFKLETPGSILVKGDVEGAWLVAGRDILVQGVVVAAPEGALKAGGRIQATRIAGDLSIEAGGDVQVAVEVYDVRLRCGGKLIVGGRVVGGDLIAVGGAEVGILGGAGYTPTRLSVGRSAILLREATEQFEEITAAVQRLERLLGVADRPSLRERLSALRAEREARLELVQRLTHPAGTATILVRRAWYPGAHVLIDGAPHDTPVPRGAGDLRSPADTRPAKG